MRAVLLMLQPVQAHCHVNLLEDDAAGNIDD
jgi:hypothetical protein